MIYINEKNREFHLQNKNSSYIFYVMENGQLGQLYYGKKIKHRDDFSHFFKKPKYGVGIIAHTKENPAFSLEYYKQEYPSYGTTDFRKPAIKLLQKNGSRISNFTYDSHTITEGKPKLVGLPSCYVEENSEAMTLEIKLVDKVINCALYLTYTTYCNREVFTRNTRLENNGQEEIFIENLMSLSIDFPDYDYEMLHLSGAWGREKHIKERILEKGVQYIDSTRGASSAQQNPFMAIKRKNTTENQGEVYGFSLVYSGNFIAQAEVDHFDVTRITMGINPFDFSWTLNEGESFQSPEVIMVYSQEGLNGMSQSFHRLLRERVARGFWRDKERPVLINNWEATYFDFDEEKLVAIAKEASKLGFELFVLDDGWFGERNGDNSSLGDWVVNKNKLPNGLEGLSKKIQEENMKLGLWFEPEMISENSELFRKNPHWVLGVDNRTLSLGRNQYILDLTKEEVRAYIVEELSKRLKEGNISYVKWDMNRNMTEIPSKETGHKYILGLYEILEKITSQFPQVLFESCASGGGRFDPGMLHYMPQTWASDNTDAIDRLKIQYGTSLVYPTISMGAHVSDIPNHQTARSTSLDIRNYVAYFGNFGYELDITKYSEETKEEVKNFVNFYKENRKLLQFGDFIRLQSPFTSNYCSWMTVSKDKSEAIVGYYEILGDTNSEYNKKIKLSGLEENTLYLVNNEYEAYGDELMNMGIVFDQPDRYYSYEAKSRDFTSKIFKIKKVVRF